MLVQLNNHGVEAINGLQSMEDAYAAKAMVITDVTSIPCDDYDLYQLEFKNHLLDRYLLTNLDVSQLYIKG